MVIKACHGSGKGNSDSIYIVNKYKSVLNLDWFRYLHLDDVHGYFKYVLVWKFQEKDRKAVQKLVAYQGGLLSNTDKQFRSW